jgi:hypothetical protein
MATLLYDRVCGRPIQQKERYSLCWGKPNTSAMNRKVSCFKTHLSPRWFGILKLR